MANLPILESGGGFEHGWCVGGDDDAPSSVADGDAQATASAAYDLVYDPPMSASASWPRLSDGCDHDALTVQNNGLMCINVPMSTLTSSPTTLADAQCEHTNAEERERTIATHALLGLLARYHLANKPNGTKVDQRTDDEVMSVDGVPAEGGGRRKPAPAAADVFYDMQPDARPAHAGGTAGMLQQVVRCIEPLTGTGLNEGRLLAWRVWVIVADPRHDVDAGVEHVMTRNHYYSHHAATADRSSKSKKSALADMVEAASNPTRHYQLITSTSDLYRYLCRYFGAAILPALKQSEVNRRLVGASHPLSLTAVLNPMFASEQPAYPNPLSANLPEALGIHEQFMDLSRYARYDQVQRLTFVADGSTDLRVPRSEILSCPLPPPPLDTRSPGPTIMGVFRELHNMSAHALDSPALLREFERHIKRGEHLPAALEEERMRRESSDIFATGSAKRRRVDRSAALPGTAARVQKARVPQLELYAEMGRVQALVDAYMRLMQHRVSDALLGPDGRAAAAALQAEATETKSAFRSEYEQMAIARAMDVLKDPDMTTGHRERILFGEAVVNDEFGGRVLGGNGSMTVDEYSPFEHMINQEAEFLVLNNVIGPSYAMPWLALLTHGMKAMFLRHNCKLLYMFGPPGCGKSFLTELLVQLHGAGTVVFQASESDRAGVNAVNVNDGKVVLHDEMPRKMKSSGESMATDQQDDLKGQLHQQRRHHTRVVKDIDTGEFHDCMYETPHHQAIIINSNSGRLAGDGRIDGPNAALLDRGVQLLMRQRNAHADRADKCAQAVDTEQRSMAMARKRKLDYVFSLLAHVQNCVPGTGANLGFAEQLCRRLDEAASVQFGDAFPNERQLLHRRQLMEVFTLMNAAYVFMLDDYRRILQRSAGLPRNDGVPFAAPHLAVLFGGLMLTTPVIAMFSWSMCRQQRSNLDETIALELARVLQLAPRAALQRLVSASSGPTAQLQNVTTALSPWELHAAAASLREYRERMHAHVARDAVADAAASCTTLPEPCAAQLAVHFGHKALPGLAKRATGSGAVHAGLRFVQLGTTGKLDPTVLSTTSLGAAFSSIASSLQQRVAAGRVDAPHLADELRVLSHRRIKRPETTFQMAMQLATQTDVTDQFGDDFLATWDGEDVAAPNTNQPTLDRFADQLSSDEQVQRRTRFEACLRNARGANVPTAKVQQYAAWLHASDPHQAPRATAYAPRMHEFDGYTPLDEQLYKRFKNDHSPNTFGAYKVASSDSTVVESPVLRLVAAAGAGAGEAGAAMQLQVDLLWLLQTAELHAEARLALRGADGLCQQVECRIQGEAHICSQPVNEDGSVSPHGLPEGLYLTAMYKDMCVANSVLTATGGAGQTVPIPFMQYVRHRNTRFMRLKLTRNHKPSPPRSADERGDMTALQYSCAFLRTPTACELQEYNNARTGRRYYDDSRECDPFVAALYTHLAERGYYQKAYTVQQALAMEQITKAYRAHDQQPTVSLSAADVDTCAGSNAAGTATARRDALFLSGTCAATVPDADLLLHDVSCLYSSDSCSDADDDTDMQCR